MNRPALPRKLLLVRSGSRTKTRISCCGLLEVKTTIPVKDVAQRPESGILLSQLRWREYMSYRRTQMKISVATVCLFALLGAAGSVAAENPFASTWKLNPAKSHLTGDTMEFAEAGSGAIRSTAGAISSTFKTDGTAYSMGEGSGFTAAWKQLGADAWEVTFKKDETVASVDTWKLSPDGKTINIESKGTKPNGENFDDTSV